MKRHSTWLIGGFDKPLLAPKMDGWREGAKSRGSQEVSTRQRNRSLPWSLQKEILSTENLILARGKQCQLADPQNYTITRHGNSHHNLRYLGDRDQEDRNCGTALAKSYRDLISTVIKKVGT
jgi:hypothetical protein